MTAAFKRGVTVAILLAAIVVVVILVSGKGGSGHELIVTVPKAESVVVGQDVREAGQKVGAITGLEPVRRGQAARIEMSIDDSAWPLHRGTKLALRFGGTISYNNRYIALTPGQQTGPALADGAAIPTRDATVPIEVDDLLRTFDAPTRTGLRNLFDNGGVTLKQAGPQLRRTLNAAPPAVTQGAAVIHDAIADQASLDTLVKTTDSVVDAVRTADPGVRDLVQGAAATLSTTAERAQGLQESIQRAPVTLRHARTTLASADDTLNEAADLTDRLGPGVAQLRRIAAPLDHLLTTITRVGPNARATLSTASAAAPDLNPLLTRVTGLAPELTSIGKQATHELTCIRPYTPEITGFASTWGDFLSPNDGKDRYIRATLQNFLPASANISPFTSGQLKNLYPGLRFGFPRPPGEVAGQSWFLPECGAGKDAIDPFEDPEARGFNASSSAALARTRVGG
ncbi:MAG: phospholipid/cholesterol/gamma-HCH transport system substrate-binding protein [Solirubrobacteraceae bacterium]|jgi:ABC-type transporter Mla subunit MlaD|nr:phospholipid/cholesterol/gamma-HCH transport system substrate-binding protein [Solirubrobacteraceae bacterium]